MSDNIYETIETIKTEIKSISRRLRVLSEMLPSEMEEHRVEIETLSERKSQLWTILKKANALIWKLVDGIEPITTEAVKPVTPIQDNDGYDREYVRSLLKTGTDCLNEAIDHLENNDKDRCAQIILTECFNEVNGVLGDYDGKEED